MLRALRNSPLRVFPEKILLFARGTADDALISTKRFRIKMREEYGGFVFARDLVLGSTVDVFDTVLFIIFFFFSFSFHRCPINSGANNKSPDFTLLQDG